MLFSSITFLFIFLPVVIGLYFFAKKEWRNYVLLVASIIFYALGNLRYLYLLFLVVVINYFGAIIIEKTKKLSEKWKFCPSFFLALFLVLNLGIFFYFKYLNFFLDNINKFMHTSFVSLEILLPIGISFYIFQAMSYIIDVYRGECIAQKSFIKHALYICLFPQLVAGPIVKYHEIEDQLSDRNVDFDNISLGAKRFIIGLSKKVLIADTLGVVADKIFIQDPNNFSHLVAWIGSVSYGFQIFYDFAGYSDMAIGLGLIFGFKFLENFNYPFISKSLSEFWKRWHISLSTWFKQYLYIPLGGSRLGKVRASFNLIIVFVLTGLWHGANWTFIVWGLWYGIFLVIEKWLNVKEFDKKEHLIITDMLRQLYCYLVFLIGAVIFRSENLAYALKYLKNMFGFITPNPDNYMYAIPFYVQKYEIIILVAAAICSFPIFKNILNQKNSFIYSAVNIWLLVLLCLSVMTIAATTYNPFIYFRF